MQGLDHINRYLHLIVLTVIAVVPSLALYWGVLKLPALWAFDDPHNLWIVAHPITLRGLLEAQNDHFFPLSRLVCYGLYRLFGEAQSYYFTAQWSAVMLLCHSILVFVFAEMLFHFTGSLLLASLFGLLWSVSVQALTGLDSVFIIFNVHLALASILLCFRFLVGYLQTRTKRDFWAFVATLFTAPLWWGIGLFVFVVTPVVSAVYFFRSRDKKTLLKVVLAYALAVLFVGGGIIWSHQKYGSTLPGKETPPGRPSFTMAKRMHAYALYQFFGWYTPYREEDASAEKTIVPSVFWEWRNPLSLIMVAFMVYLFFQRGKRGEEGWVALSGVVFLILYDLMANIGRPFLYFYSFRYMACGVFFIVLSQAMALKWGLTRLNARESVLAKSALTLCVGWLSFLHWNAVKSSVSYQRRLVEGRVLQECLKEKTYQDSLRKWFTVMLETRNWPERAPNPPPDPYCPGVPVPKG